MLFIKANDVQTARNVALNYTLVSGEAKFNLLDSNIKYEEVHTDKVLGSDEGMFELLTESLLDYLFVKSMGNERLDIWRITIV